MELAKKLKVDDNRYFFAKGCSHPITNLNHSDPWEEKLNAEEHHLLNLLPEDIWLLLMDQLSDDPRDLEQLSNASPYFRQLLLPRRVLFLFPAVLHLQMILPTLRYVGAHQILNYRLVCSRWNKSVDIYIQRGHYCPESGTYKHVKQSRLPSSLCYTFETLTSNSLQRFLEHFENTHSAKSSRSPFINSILNVRFFGNSNTRDKLHALNQTTTLFEKYGHYILDLGLSIPTDLPYLKLREWLQLLPNLKNLELDVADGLGIRPMRVNERQINVEIKEFPLSKFFKIERLQINRLPAPTFNEVIRAANPISCLSYEQVFVNNDVYDINVAPIENLKSLAVRFTSQRHFAQFSKSSKALLAPLTSLEITFSDMVFVRWPAVFQVIQDKWGDTLQKLDLHLPHARDSHEALQILSDSYSLRFKSHTLRHLKLRMHNPAHLDFLLPLRKSLEKIKIERRFSLDCPSKRKDEAEESFKPVVQFIGFETRMYESNIWSLFSNLKEICLYDDMWSRFNYTRENVVGFKNEKV